MKVRTLLTTALAGLTLGTMALIGAPQAIARDRGGRNETRQDSRQYGGDSYSNRGCQGTYGQKRGNDRHGKSFRDKEKQNRGRHRGWYKSNERGRENGRQYDRDGDRDR
jgi:hypothetical protein